MSATVEQKGSKPEPPINCIFGLKVILEGFDARLEPINHSNPLFAELADLTPRHLTAMKAECIDYTDVGSFHVTDITIMQDGNMPVFCIVSGYRTAIIIDAALAQTETFMFIRRVNPDCCLFVQKYQNIHEFEQGTDLHPYGFDTEDIRRNPESFGSILVCRQEEGYLIKRVRLPTSTAASSSASAGESSTR